MWKSVLRSEGLCRQSSAAPSQPKRAPAGPTITVPGRSTDAVEILLHGEYELN